MGHLMNGTWQVPVPAELRLRAIKATGSLGAGAAAPYRDPCGLEGRLLGWEEMIPPRFAGRNCGAFGGFPGYAFARRIWART